MTSRQLAVACFSWALLLEPPLVGQAQSLSVTYLGNMGVAIQRSGKTVVVDGFHRGELAEYAAVPPRLLDALEQVRHPFLRIDAMLTTHRHRDHFDARSVAERLGRDSATVFVAAQETVDSLGAAFPAVVAGNRTRGIALPDAGRVDLKINGVPIAVLDLPHNPTPSRRVANVGFLVDMDGIKVLQVGDADPLEASFARHGLVGQADVAIVPFWYLTGRSDVLRVIGAKRYVASHIPLSDTAEVRRQVGRLHPRATILARPGENVTLEVPPSRP